MRVDQLKIAVPIEDFLEWVTSTTGLDLDERVYVEDVVPSDAELEITIMR